MKGQNIYIEPLLNLRIPTAHHVLKHLIYVKNVKIWPRQNIAKEITIYLGYLIFSKNPNELPKLAQWPKKQSGGRGRGRKAELERVRYSSTMVQ